MSYNYCKDHRSGITYVYDVTSQVGEDGKRHSIRKLVGRLDETGHLVPTSGRKGRLPKKRELPPLADPNDEYSKEINALHREIAELKASLELLEKEKKMLINGMQKLLSQVE